MSAAAANLSGRSLELFFIAGRPDGKLTDGHAFSTPSAAAALVLGWPVRERTEWDVVGSGQTCADWDAAHLVEMAP